MNDTDLAKKKKLCFPKLKRSQGYYRRLKGIFRIYSTNIEVEPDNI